MGNIIESLIKYLLKKNTIKLLKIENSFFLYKQLDKKINLSKDIIRLNYLHESPFSKEKNSITSIIFEKHLLLWFSKGEQQSYLPEALLIYRNITKKHKNILCIIKDNIEKVVIVKDGILVSSFSKRKIKEHDIHLLKDKYNIDNTITISANKYSDFLQKSYKYITPKDILNILNIQIDFKSLSTNLLKFIAFPMFISSIIIVAFLWAYLYTLEKNEHKLKEIFLKNKANTLEIKESVNNNQRENIQFTLLSNEFKYYEKPTVISNIIKVTKDMNMSMYYIKVHENKVDFIVRTKNQKDIPLYVKKLFKSKYFIDVKNISSFKLRNGTVQITMTAKVKER